MRKITVFTTLILLLVLAVGCGCADMLSITYTSGEEPFLYGGHTYIPLRTASDFIGAQITWDPSDGHIGLSYMQKALVLYPYNNRAYFAGEQVMLAVTPVVVGGRTFIPIGVFKQFYSVPMEWDSGLKQVKIKGPNGWGVMKVKSKPAWKGGPPDWARANGYRYMEHHGTPPGHANKDNSKNQKNNSGKAKGKNK